MRVKITLLTMALALLLGAGSAQATPIAYSGQLLNGVAVLDVNLQAPGNQSNPQGAEYWLFFANAGSAVDINGDRLSGHYDMSLWIFEDVYGDTNQFGASFPGLQAGNCVASCFYDDNDPPFIPGPFGDPRAIFVAPITGYYTIAVTNFLSSAGPPNPFRLTATGVQNVPEPASMLLLGTGLAGLAGAARRRARARKAK